jgi:hypothetical protein
MDQWCENCSDFIPTWRGARGETTMKSKATNHYQNILRAIGQGLETLEALSFDLEVSDGHYVVRGECKKNITPDTSQATLKKSFLSLVIDVTEKNTIRTGVSPPFHFTGLRFTRSDIELLKRKGKLLRSKFADSAPDPHRLSQILRTVGAYLDQDGCRLVKLSWRDGCLTLWHINRHGFDSKEILTPFALYDWWVRQYKHRRPMRLLLKRTGND